MTNGWLYLTLIYDGDEASVFTNGCLSATGKVEQPLENELPLAFGALSNGGDASLNGQYDEIRLRGGTLSADRIKADYDMIANREFLSYGAVRAGCEAAVK